MLTKMFNVAALAGNFILDTIRAPQESYRSAKEHVFKSNTIKAEDSGLTRGFYSVVAGSYSASLTIGPTSLLLLGALTTGVAMTPVVGLGCLAGGMMSCGLISKGMIALNNKIYTAGEPVKDDIYAPTIESYKKLTR
tara:strand:+ start:234039 stop:234449 length:411 start_codon:yes stop_codon:yes gene_type:complete